MSQTTVRAARPTTAADLWRLADQGRRNGVRILTECVSGERFATSVSEPGTLYRLTAYSCTCPGFTHTGRCQHHSLLLADLGWLPEPDTDLEPAAPAAPAVPVAPRAIADKELCPECEGVGCTDFDEDDAGTWWPARPCAVCGGDGLRPESAPAAPWDFVECEGRGFYTRASAVFAEMTYRFNCRRCRFPCTLRLRLASGRAPSLWPFEIRIKVDNSTGLIILQLDRLLQQLS